MNNCRHSQIVLKRRMMEASNRILKLWFLTVRSHRLEGVLEIVVLLFKMQSKEISFQIYFKRDGYSPKLPKPGTEWGSRRATCFGTTSDWASFPSDPKKPMPKSILERNFNYFSIIVFIIILLI